MIETGASFSKTFPSFAPTSHPSRSSKPAALGGMSLVTTCQSLHTPAHRIYFNPKGGKPGILGPSVDITHTEFPQAWFAGLKPKAYRARVYTVGTNKYAVR